MQYDDRQQDIDASGQGYPFDPFGQGPEDQANRAPGGRPYTDQPQQAAGQGLDPMQQRRQRDLGGPGGFDRQAQPGQEDYSQQQGQQGLGGIDDFGWQEQSGQDDYEQQKKEKLGHLADIDQQAQADQGDYSQQQGQPGLGDPGQQAQPGLGGVGDMVGNQGSQRANASNDPNNPYGNVDDILADYGNTQADQGQLDL